jgi:PST family polysaccharide transporter
MNGILSERRAEGLKAKAVKGAGINVATRLVSFVAHTVGVIVLARILTPEEFGLVAMVTAFSLWIMNFGVNGFTEFIIQKDEIGKREVNAIFWIHVFLASVLAFGFAGFGAFLVYFYAERALNGIAAAMATSFILYALFTCHFAVLKRELKFGIIAVVQLVAMILSIIFAIVAALGGMGYWAVVIRQLTMPTVMLVGAWLLCPWRPGSPRYLSAAIPGLKYAVKVYCNFSIGYLTRSVDKVLLGRFHGPELLGNYDRGYHLSSLPAGQLVTPLHSVALATLSRLQHDSDRFGRYYINAVSMVAFLGTLAAVCLTLAARDLIPLLLGPEWIKAGLVVMAFGPGIAAMLVYETHSWLHLSLGKPGRWLRWNLVATALTMTAFVIAAPFGAVAMAIAYSVISYVLVVPALWYAGWPVHLRISNLIRCVWSYFASGTIVVVCWLYMCASWPALNSVVSGFRPLNRVAVTLLVGVVFYLLLVILLERSVESLRMVWSFTRIFVSREQTNDQA